MDDRSEVASALSGIDGLIRSGEGIRARREIRKLQRKGLVIPALRSQLAALARRAGIAEIGVRLLDPIVHPQGRRLIPAREQDWAEYAACLIRVGAVEEAMAILSSLDAEANPEVLLFRSYGEVAQWNYEGSLAPLQQYLARSTGADPYLRLVAQANLLAALVERKRHAEAEELARVLLEATGKLGLKLLRGNIFDYAAQNAVSRGNWEEAERLLNQAEDELSRFGASDALFIAKWKAIVEVKKNANPVSLRALNEVRQLAAGRGHWETIRSCDYYRAVATRDPLLFRYVYFGTPHSAFRQRMEKEWFGAEPIGDIFDWRLGNKGKDGKRLDLVGIDKRERKTSGDLVHALLLALAQDFYRPARLAGLHSKLYPSEPFNPSSSAHRVFRLVQRLRSWLQETGYPLKVEEDGGSYRLSASQRITIHVGLESPLHKDRSDHFLDELRSVYAEVPFRAEEAAERLGLSARTVLNRLKDGIERGYLRREGRARACRYRLVSPSK